MRSDALLFAIAVVLGNAGCELVVSFDRSKIVDAGSDAGVDAGSDAGSDAGTDAGTDAGADAGP